MNNLRKRSKRRSRKTSRKRSKRRSQKTSRKRSKINSCCKKICNSVGKKNKKKSEINQCKEVCKSIYRNPHCFPKKYNHSRHVHWARLPRKTKRSTRSHKRSTPAKK